MKLISFILSILIFGTAILPCSDAISLNESHNELSLDHHFHDKDKDITSSSSHSHNHDQDHEDSCSPFCTCSCCGIQIINPSFIYLDQCRNEFQFGYLPGFAFHYDMQYSKGIWNPPTLS